MLTVEFLGSGGAVPTPRPGCECRICAEARLKGVPYSRTG
jgi:phosphoribosyl 1,2-cyclic phosphate phosphodiesterase